MSEPDKNQILVKGHKIELSEGRSVSVGQADNGDEDFYITLVNKEGYETKFKITPEATEALCELLTHALGNRGWRSEVSVSA